MPPETPPKAAHLLIGRITFLLGTGALLAAVALSIRTYMPCPFWDEWAFVNAIAQGKGLHSGRWLWSQHNEHRLLVTRLLILIDLHWFEGKNLSLFFEMFLAQAFQWAAICYTLERLTSFPMFLKRTLEGLFAFCLFHFNQAENFTWAFQVSFVLAFCLATSALLGVAFFGRLRWPWLIAAALGIMPFVAALNVAGGLAIGPIVIVVGLLRRIATRYMLLICLLFVGTALAYLSGYRVPPSHLTPMEALAHPKGIFTYVLTYFGASWTRLLPHKERITCFLSLLVFATLIVIALRNRDQIGAFEWFCIAECSLMIAIAIITALGRLQYGVGQAYAGRYQTPAMLYWASLSALLLITVWRFRPQYFGVAQGFVLVVAIASAATFIPIWRSTASHADQLSAACHAVMSGNQDERAAKLLYGSRQDVAPGVDYLHRVWH